MELHEGKWIRQGDVSLHKIDKLPAGFKEVKVTPLAYGEVTGHQHFFKNEKDVKMYKSNGSVCVEVLKETELVHDFKAGVGVLTVEKATQQDMHVLSSVPIGFHAVTLEKEENPFTQEIEQVLD